MIYKKVLLKVKDKLLKKKYKWKIWKNYIKIFI